MAKHPLEEVTFRASTSFGKRECAPGWYWDHQTPFHDYDIFYIVSGKGTMQLSDGRFDLHKKSCLVMRPGDIPKAVQDPHDRMTVLYMHFQVSEANGPIPDFSLPRFTVVGDAFRAEHLLYQMMELLEFPAPLRDLEFDCLMKQFFVNLFRLQLAPQHSDAHSAKQMQTVRAIMAYIREAQGVDVGLAELAEAVNMSPPYISRLFKACSGVTLKQFIANTKAERARELLLQTRMSIGEVAERMGYSDVYAFSKSFKRVFRLSPSDYMAQARLSRQAPGSQK